MGTPQSFTYYHGEMPLLAITVAGHLESDERRVRIPVKTLSALSAFAALWPGEMSFVTHTLPITQESPPGWADVEQSSLGFEIRGTSDRLRVLQQLRPDATLIGLARSELPLLEAAPGRIAVVVENDLRNRMRWAYVGNGRRIPPRESIGLMRLERRYRKALKRAAAIQANGPSAYRAYGRDRPALLFFDHRVRQSQVEATAATAPAQRLDIAFSGRWLVQKGIYDAVAAFRRSGLRDSSLALIGSGPDNPGVGPDEPQIMNVGNLDFDSEWLPYIRSKIRLMLLPHLQGDPAGTFLEAAGAGAPFLSYRTRHSQYLADQGMGWTVPMGDVSALAHRLNELTQQADEIERARDACLRFLAQHSFDEEMGRRTEQLVTMSKSGRN